MLVKLGQVVANEENGLRLLEQDQLVAVFPEGQQGVEKVYSERYQLASFGQGGFIQMAIRTSSPIFPIAIVGAEETYISLANPSFPARRFGMPYFPLTLIWPWLGIFGLIPFPSKWFIDVGDPIFTDQYSMDTDDNSTSVSQISDNIRSVIQGMIAARLEDRKSVLFG